MFYFKQFLVQRFIVYQMNNCDFFIFFFLVIDHCIWPIKTDDHPLILILDEDTKII